MQSLRIGATLTHLVRRNPRPPSTDRLRIVMTHSFKLNARNFGYAAVLFVVVAALAAPAFAQTDLGPTAGTETKTVSLALRVRDPAGLEAFIDSTVTPGHAQFRQFLTVEQFAERFAPSAQEVAEVVRHMQSAGIQVNETAPNRLLLKATGTVADLNRYFSVSIHQFENQGRRYHAPLSLPQMPAGITGSALAVAGLSDEAVFVPHFKPLGSVEPGAAVSLSSSVSGTATGEPGSFTVGEVARLYQLNPLYRSGISGRGRTVGIATMTTFDQADAYAYWSAIGLAVKPNRITEVPVDGGAVADGTSETTLEVQQAGGLAPGPTSSSTRRRTRIRASSISSSRP